VKNFIVPTRCTTNTVNAALEAAGVKTSIFRDPYNNNRYSVCYHIEEENGGEHLTMDQTFCNTARQVALEFADGERGIYWRGIEPDDDEPRPWY
jgi:hypothetical protein